MGHHDKAAVSISSDNSESVLIRDIPAKAAKRVSADTMVLRITIVQWFSIRVSSDTLVKADTTQETMTFLGEL